MAKDHSVAVPGFPAPLAGYDRVNEAQFRADVTRTLQAMVAYTKRTSDDPSAFTPHELASVSALGPQHTVAGLTTGQVLIATGATTAAFQALVAGNLPGIPASSVLAGTFGSGNYVFPGTLEITGTLFPDGQETRDLGIFSTNAWRKIFWGIGGVLSDDQGGSIELGDQSTTPSTPFIDFHSGAFATDFDYRIIASGGTFLDGNATGTFRGSVHDFPIGGMILGPATGGNKGTGTLNVSGDIFKNNTAFVNPDYVFEEKYLGRGLGQSPRRVGWRGLETINEKRAYVQEHHRFAAVRQGPMGTFERGEVMLEVVEEQFLHICELHDRLEAAEEALDALSRRVGPGGPNTPTGPGA